VLYDFGVNLFCSFHMGRQLLNTLLTSSFSVVYRKKLLLKLLQYEASLSSLSYTLRCGQTCLMLGSWERSGSPQSRDPNICSVSCLSLDCAYQNSLSCSNLLRHQCQLSWVSVCHVLLIMRQKWVILKTAYALYTDSLFLPADRSSIFG